MMPDLVAVIVALILAAVLWFGAWVLIVMILLGGLIFALFDKMRGRAL